MARLASQEKALFYPTPMRIIPLIHKHIVVSGSEKQTGIVLDTCCGDGEPAQYLAALLGKKWRAYGVELDMRRAEKAAQVMGEKNVINAALQDTHIDGTADVLFLNPPYDHDSTAGRRMELQFLDWSARHLRYDGILVYIIEEMFVGDGKYAEETASALRQNKLGRTIVYRFPEPEYQDFNQVVILAQKSTYGHTSIDDLVVKGTIGDTDDSLSYWQRYGQIVQLDQHIPARRLLFVKKFEDKPEPSLVAQENWRAFETFLGEPSSATGVSLRPLTSLKETNAVLVACSGLLNNTVIDGKVIKGATYTRKSIEDKKATENGKEWKVVEKTPTRFITLDLATNEIETIDEAENYEKYADFLIRNARTFVDTCIQNYPPLYTPADRLDFQHIRPPNKLPGRENVRGLLPQQEELASAVIRGLAEHKIVNIIAQMGVGKTAVSVGAMYTYLLKKKWLNKKVIVLIPSSPADLADKWVKEIKIVLADHPEVWAMHVESISEVQQAFARPGIGFIVIREYYAKAASPWLTVEPHYQKHHFYDEVSDKKRTIKIPICPHCLEQLATSEMETIENNLAKEQEAVAEGKEPYSATGRRQLVCGDVYQDGELVKKGCQNAFWTRISNGKKPRDPIARFIRQHYSRQYVLIADECFPGNTLIETINGPVPIKDIQVGDLVLTENNGELTYRKVIRTYIQPKLKSMVKVTHSKGSFICTEDHKIFIKGKKVQAKDLRKEDKLLYYGTSLCEAEVIKVEEVEINDDYVYDLEVEDTHRYFAAGVLVSNCHEYKGGDTGRGNATQDLITGCCVGVQMTGTFFNGKASGVFYLLYRSSPEFRQMYAHDEAAKFTKRYGVEEQVMKEIEQKSGGSTYSGYRLIEGKPREAPGLHPSLAALILPNTVFMSKHDLDFEMVAYSEHTLFVEPDPEHFKAWKGYTTALSDAAKGYMSEYTKEGMRQASSIFAFARLASNRVLDRPDVEESYPGEAVYIPPQKPPNYLFPKEIALVRLVLREKERGRKCLIYVHQMKGGDPSPRLVRALSKYGLRAAVMYANTKERLQFIRSNLQKGNDCIITNHQLVKVGVNIVETPTIIWYSLEKQMNTLEIPQANERPHRIHQTEPVEVYYLGYDQTVQAETATYIAKKVGVMQRFQGDVRSGLVALEDEADLVSELQDVVSTQQHFESDLSVDELPELRIASPGKKKVVAKTAGPPVTITTTEIGGGAVQLGFL